jgi:hypothetical protein
MVHPNIYSNQVIGLDHKLVSCISAVLSLTKPLLISPTEGTINYKRVHLAVLSLTKPLLISPTERTINYKREHFVKVRDSDKSYKLWHQNSTPWRYVQLP